MVPLLTWTQGAEFQARFICNILQYQLVLITSSFYFGNSIEQKRLEARIYTKALLHLISAYRIRDWNLQQCLKNVDNRIFGGCRAGATWSQFPQEMALHFDISNFSNTNGLYYYPENSIDSYFVDSIKLDVQWLSHMLPYMILCRRQSEDGQKYNGAKPDPVLTYLCKLINIILEDVKLSQHGDNAELAILGLLGAAIDEKELRLQAKIPGPGISLRTLLHLLHSRPWDRLDEEEMRRWHYVQLLLPSIVTYYNCIGIAFILHSLGPDAFCEWALNATFYLLKYLPRNNLSQCLRAALSMGYMVSECLGSRRFSGPEENLLGGGTYSPNCRWDDPGFTPRDYICCLRSLDSIKGNVDLLIKYLLEDPETKDELVIGDFLSILGSIDWTGIEPSIGLE
ncbi:hypothetical protein M422DRAFT_51979 [Sphaerobolus stellatus SS14]|uniref:Uncharacterized protein n=1 Tax=Sphaerobolus stellatus (strain SS14) TaxID=990650 RepID=A0A0C9UI85_SPHS4|nr:hypothetical protein M422DRAFT_51979 [Sphaerobolus stellatus SS14]